MTRPHHIAAALVLCLAAVAGCQGGGDDSPREGPAPRLSSVADLRALPFSDGSVGVARTALAAAGVGVYPDDATDSTEPVRLTEWQTRNLAAEAANGGGVRGGDLAALTGTPTGAPPIGYLVAAWITTYDSQGARFAKELMGQQDWRMADRIRFPRLVLALFLADATSSATGGASPTPSAHAMGDRLPAYRLVAAGPCTTATTFVQNAILAVANALKVNTAGGGLFGFLGRIWNAAVDLAAGLVKGLIDTVTRPVVNLMVQVFGVVATIAQVTSYLSQWRATARPSPEQNRFGVDSEVVTGQVRVTVDHAQLPVPEIVLDCADAFGVDLRDAGSTAGSGVTWDTLNEGRPDLSVDKAFDDKLDAGKSARYTYQTGQEPRDVADSGQQHSGLLRVDAAVQRNDIEKVRELFTSLLLDQLPAAIRAVVEPYAAPILHLATQKLTALADVSTVAYVPIAYHTRTPSPSPRVSRPAIPSPKGGRATVPTNCPNAAVAEFGYSSLGSRIVDGVLTCFYAPGQLGIGISDKKATAHTCASAEPVDVPGAEAAWIDEGSCGSPSVMVVASNGTLLVAGGDGGPDEIIAVAKRILG